jgi:glycosyltransferase involved in cell wall biosynthesis
LRVTFLTVMPSPYSLDLFAAMEVDGRITPHVLYLEMAAPDTYWGQVPLPESAEVLAGGWRNFGGGRVHWNPGAIAAVRRSRPDLVVVSGYSSLTSQVVMRWLRRKKFPWVFWGEIPGMRRLGTLGRRLRALAQAPALRADAIAGIGSKAVDEYRRLAAPACDVVNIPYYTDLTPFIDEPRPERDNIVRMLYCGQLIERKGLRVLIDAFMDVAKEFPDVELVLVGEGPLRSPLIERLPAEVKNRVVFAGFQPVHRLPSYFAQADLFVLPSLHDGWGVVVNQALAAGLPVICSNAVGAAADLVTPGQNGFVVSPGDSAELAAAIRALLSDRDRRIEFGRNSRAAALEWLPPKGVDRWVDLAERVLQRRVPKPAGTVK